MNSLLGSNLNGHPACAGEDPELFFPLPNEVDAEARAKSICAGCSVKGECLDFAMQNSVVGIWGGTNDEERHAIRVSQRIRRAVA